MDEDELKDKELLLAEREVCLRILETFGNQIAQGISAFS